MLAAVRHGFGIGRIAWTCLDEPELLQLISAYLDGAPITEFAMGFERSPRAPCTSASAGRRCPGACTRKVKSHQVAEEVELYRMISILGVVPGRARRVLVEAGSDQGVSDRPRRSIVDRVRLRWWSQLMASSLRSPAILTMGREADIDRLVVVTEIK